MYKCAICQAISRPKEPLIRLTIPKRDKPYQIDRELPVCRACAKQIEMGMSIKEIVSSLKPSTSETPAVAPPTEQPVEL